jgi:GT2 family glycosyltransferase
VEAPKVAEEIQVSVIIPTHQRREALRRALASLSRQGSAAGAFEVVVSIDGSIDGTREMLDALDPPYPLRVAAGPRRGRAAACNAALAIARGEVLIILDDDMQVVPEFVERHRAHHPPDSRLCVLGAVPIELNGSSPLAARYVRSKFNAHLAALAKPDHRFMPRDFYSGNASLRTDAMREINGFDESFSVYGNEDVDLSLRLQANGVELVYDPGALAHQEYGKDLLELARDTFHKGHTTVLLARAHPSVFHALRLAAPRENSRPWLVARSVLLSLTRHRRSIAERVFRLATALERLGLWRQPLFYRASLDYAFWAGVDAELSQSTDQGELDRLAIELHRGPIDLLLHG